MSEASIFQVTFDTGKLNIVLTVNIFLLMVAIGLPLIFLAIRKMLAPNKKIQKDIVSVELAYKVGGIEMKYQVVRNYINLEIAHKIYVELITRKAAIEIDETHDVINEVYSSWYQIFQVTRDEIKKLSGNLLENNRYSDDLIKISTDVLNKGLRPHLTMYQARFRKWYAEELSKEENKNKAPQEIQMNYPGYDKLVESMKEVNKILIDYASQLNKFIKGGSYS